MNSTMKCSFRVRLAVLCLTTCMLFSGFPFATCATTVEENNLIRNSGFDNSETMMEDWSHEVGVSKEWKSQNGSVYATSIVTNEKATAEGGNGYAIKLTNSIKLNELYARQNVKSSQGIVPGATYKFSYRIYADNLDHPVNRGVGAYLTSYENDSMGENHIETVYILYKDDSTNNKWAEVSGTFVFPLNGKSLRILMRSYAVGTVYFDDISLTKIGDPEKFEYNTSHVFHYKDEKQGTAKVSIVPYYRTGANKLNDNVLTAKFVIYDAGKYVTGQDVPFSDFEATYTYAVDNLTILKKEYTLRITVLDENNREMGSPFTQSLYKYERPKFLDADGFFCNKEGKRVPFINAWDIKQKDFEIAGQVGFTSVTMVYNCRRKENEAYTENYINAFDAEGLVGLFTLYDEENRPAAHDANKENTRFVVEKYKNDRRILGWVVQDEPLGSGITEEKKKLLEESYKFIRDIDPNHPVILTDYNRGVFNETAKYCDIFMPNSYGRGFSGVRTYVEEAIDYSNGRPVCPNICAYSSNQKLEGLPTGQQVQHFIHQAFLAGAKGVSVYSFSNPVIVPYRHELYKTDIWDSLVYTCKNEIPILYDLFVHAKEKPEETKTSTYIQRKWARTDGDYYFLMSISNSAVTAEYDIGVGKDVKLLGGDSTDYFTISDGKLCVSLDSFDVLMFEVFDAIRVIKNGVVIGKTEAGQLQISAPEKTRLLMTCLYKTEDDGRQELIRIETAEGNVMPFLIDETEVKYDIEVYAWDDTLSPSAEPYHVPGL